MDIKRNLSSQIKLSQIPAEYYNPKGEVELAQLTRNEKIYTKIFETPVAGADYVAQRIVRVINESLEQKGQCVLGLGVGPATHQVYARLIELNKQGKVSFKNVVVFSILEFFPQEPGNASAAELLKEVLLSHVDIQQRNIRSIGMNVTKENMYEQCRSYERAIERAGGLDLILCEMGRTGSLALNSPGSITSSMCRLVLLSNEDHQRLESSYKGLNIPSTAITLGMKDIMNAKRIIALAWGDEMAEMVSNVVEGDVSMTLPASALQLHPHSRVITDLASASQLTRLSHPWKVSSCRWTDKMIRRAIVWLCSITGKVILKLTDKDYEDNGLGELLALYGSAYNVNIKVFNELQHTITGWPGGKPNADDSSRPERALPYPKRVLIFSPHPDDDVISMGATFQRLVDQGHDVHVAYETTGNIAVGDEDMMRYFYMMDRIAPIFGFDNDKYKDLSAKVSKFVSDKAAGSVDLNEIRQIKTMIREAEATIADRFIGLTPEQTHFLRLPFYETGTIKKGELTEKDIQIVVELLEKIKPNQIFVAGDLADPHGTHRVCTDAVLAAIDILKDKPWMKECRIWMYRGAWAEWEIDHIEMAVPISPEQLRHKRNTILKHQSQMENAPFLGDDDRLFWQRAEERNRATAELFQNLGLASYEAMEAFVQYKPEPEADEEEK